MAGEKEARIIRVVHSELLSSDSQVGSGSGDDAEVCDSKAASPQTRRRRLDFAPLTCEEGGDSGGC